MSYFPKIILHIFLDPINFTHFQFLLNLSFFRSLELEWLNENVPGVMSIDPVSDYISFCKTATETVHKIDPNFEIQMAGGLWPRSFRKSLLAGGIADSITTAATSHAPCMIAPARSTTQGQRHPSRILNINDTVAKSHRNKKLQQVKVNSRHM